MIQAGYYQSISVDHPSMLTQPSARRRGHLLVLRTLEESRVVGGVHLQRGLGGDGGGAATASRPGVRVEELTGVIGAVAETRSVEALVRPVHFLRCVAFHEEIHRHDTCSLEGQNDKVYPKVPTSVLQ